MSEQSNMTEAAIPVRETLQDKGLPGELAARPAIRQTVDSGCDDCRAGTAFHAWRDQHLDPSFNTSVDFASWGIPPAGKRAVIELVTASILVPAGEQARLRMNTSLGSTPSNIDLVLTPQGVVGGNEVLVGTHTIRAYSDRMIEFNVNRDNAQTGGSAFICISGYLVG